jgi:hypothetical protein
LIILKRYVLILKLTGNEIKNRLKILNLLLLIIHYYLIIKRNMKNIIPNNILNIQKYLIS